MKQIVIKLSVNGTVEAETVGMQGDECQKYLSQIALLTESVPIESLYKKEFYEDSELRSINDSHVLEVMKSEVKYE